VQVQTLASADHKEPGKAKQILSWSRCDAGGGADFAMDLALQLLMRLMSML